MVELEWSGPGKSSVAGYGIVTSGTTLDVDEQTADRLLAHHSGGWSRVESDPSETANEAAPTDLLEPSDPDPVATADPDPEPASDRTPESESADESARPEDITADETGGERADLTKFFDEHWRTMVQTINAGRVDTHLDDIEAAERERDSPRSSVLEAIDMRRQDRREGGGS